MYASRFRVGRLFPRQINLWLGAGIVGCLAVVAVAAPLLVTFAPNEFHITDRLQAPSATYLFGTDIYGRDVFSRVVLGTRHSLTLGILAAGLSLLFGVPLAVIAGYFRGRVDQVMSRLADFFLSFPPLLLALLVLAVTPAGIGMAMLVVGMIYVPRVFRVIRSMVLSIVNDEYIEAAHARGEKLGYILFRELLPNLTSIILVEGSLRISFAILLGAALGYLGLGAQPPAPEWGLMINETREYFSIAPWAAIFPGIAMSLTILGFNLLAEGANDLLDPKAGVRR